MIGGGVDGVARRGGGEHIGDEALIPAAHLMVEGKAVVRAPVPGQRLAAALRMPVPFDLAPEPCDALAQAPLGGGVGVEELAGAKKPLKQKGGLDDVAAIVLAAERNGRAGAPVQEMRKEAVIGGGALQKGEHGVEPRRPPPRVRQNPLRRRR